MKEDAWLIAAVFVVWAVLSVLYYTVPMIQMPTTARVWGFGALLFLALAVVLVMASRRRGMGKAAKRAKALGDGKG